jgi:hypothetical protein
MSSAHTVFVYEDGPFRVGAMVLVTLNSPREKFWGMVLGLTGVGLSIRGVELSSFDDFTRMIRTGDAASTSDVFFPMQRIERIELDAASGDLPSLSQRFEEKTGNKAADLFKR